MTTTKDVRRGTTPTASPDLGAQLAALEARVTAMEQTTTMNRDLHRSRLLGPVRSQAQRERAKEMQERQDAAPKRPAVFKRFVKERLVFGPGYAAHSWCIATAFKAFLDESEIPEIEGYGAEDLDVAIAALPNVVRAVHPADNRAKHNGFDGVGVREEWRNPHDASWNAAELLKDGVILGSEATHSSPMG